MQSKGWLLVVWLFPAIAIGCGAEAPASSADPVVTITNSYHVTGHAVTAETTDPALVEAKDHLTRLVNDWRMNQGLSVLVPDLEADSLSLGQAIHMGECDFDTHENPEGERPADRALRAGITFSAIGENLAFGQLTAEAAIQDWLASPLHRAILESPTFTIIGAAYYGGNWVVTLLAPPAGQ